MKKIYFLLIAFLCFGIKSISAQNNHADSVAAARRIDSLLGADDKAANDKIAADKAARKIDSLLGADDKAASDKVAADKAANDKIAADKAARKIDSLLGASDKATSDKVAADKAASDKAAADKIAADKVAADKAANDKIAADKAAADKAANDKATSDKVAADKAAADKTADDKAASDKVAADKVAADRAASDKVAADKAAADKAANDKVAADKAASDKVAADKAASDKAAAKSATNDIIVSVNAGLSMPGGDYKSPLATPNYAESEVSGFSKAGFHFDIDGTYMLVPQFGLTASFGQDKNQSNSVNQYMVGVYLLAPLPKTPISLHFMGMVGYLSANIKNITSSTDLGNLPATQLPGSGTGLGGYLGAGVSVKTFQQLYCNLSLGGLFSGVSFSNGTLTTETYHNSDISNPHPYYTTSVSTQNMTMKLRILELNLGICYHFMVH